MLSYIVQFKILKQIGNHFCVLFPIEYRGFYSWVSDSILKSTKSIPTRLVTLIKYQQNTGTISNKSMNWAAKRGWAKRGLLPQDLGLKSALKRYQVCSIIHIYISYVYSIIQIYFQPQGVSLVIARSLRFLSAALSMEIISINKPEQELYQQQTHKKD